MDKIFYSAFDFFTHVIPGFCILSSFFILDSSITDAQQFLKLSSQMTIGSGVFLLIISYIVGFAVGPLGQWLHKNIGLKIFRYKFHEDLRLFISDKFILIREFSPNNFRYVETWHMFSAMAYNLAIASLFVLIMSILKIWLQNPPNAIFWWCVALASIMFFFLFLYRAVKFNLWANDDLNAAIKILHMEDLSIQKTLKKT